MAVESLELAKDANGESASAPSILTYCNASPLVANTVVSITVPSGARIAVFSATVNIWVDQEATAAIPSVAVTNGSAAILNPAARQVTAGATLSIISAEPGYVHVEFYK